MPETRRQRLTAIEEEDIRLDNQTHPAEPTYFADAEPGAVNEQIVFLEREMAKISARLNQLSINSTNSNRETTPAEDVLKSLQTPSTLRDIVPFDGNPIKLHQFLKAVDRIMPIMQRASNSPMFDVWMQAIRSKVIGDADTVLELYGTELNWDEIKSNLITHYHDKRDEVSLTRDLFKLSQTNTVQELYESISYIISLLINQLNFNEKDSNVKTAKQKYYQEIGLKVFVAGLRPPLGPIIRAQQPSTLKEALRFCSEESNYNYVQSSFKPQTSSPSNASAVPKHISPQQQRLPYRPPPQRAPWMQHNNGIRPPYNSNQTNFRPPYPQPHMAPPPNTFGYNHKQPPINSSFNKVNQGTNAAFNTAYVPQAPFQNFPKPNQFRKPSSGRTHRTQAYTPNFQVEDESHGYDYWPNDDANQYNEAYYYEEYEPSQNNDEITHNIQHDQNASSNSFPLKQMDTPEDELNFHLVEQAAMKR